MTEIWWKPAFRTAAVIFIISVPKQLHGSYEARVKLEARKLRASRAITFAFRALFAWFSVQRKATIGQPQRVHGSTSVPRKLTFPRFDRVKLSKPRNYPRFELRPSILVHLHVELFFLPFFFLPFVHGNCFCESIGLRATRLKLFTILLRVEYALENFVRNFQIRSDIYHWLRKVNDLRQFARVLKDIDIFWGEIKYSFYRNIFIFPVSIICLPTRNVMEKSSR